MMEATSRNPEAGGHAVHGNDLRPWVDRWLASWTGNDPQRLIAFYAQDAYYQDPARPHGLRGHHELLPYFEKLLAANPSWRWEAVEILTTAKGCCLKWKATLPKAGQVRTLYGLDIVELASGSITRNEVYFDPTPMR
jgi:hypothetical protein